MKKLQLVAVHINSLYNTNMKCLYGIKENCEYRSTVSSLTCLQCKAKQEICEIEDNKIFDCINKKILEDAEDPEKLDKGN